MNSQEFIKKMAQDEALRKKLAACKTPEEAYAAAQENGLTDGFEAFTAAMSDVYKQAKSELTDEELEQIAGGATNAGAVAAGIFSLALAVSAAV